MKQDVELQDTDQGALGGGGVYRQTIPLMFHAEALGTRRCRGRAQASRCQQEDMNLKLEFWLSTVFPCCIRLFFPPTQLTKSHRREHVQETRACARPRSHEVALQTRQGLGCRVIEFSEPSSLSGHAWGSIRPLESSI